jgi:hypothetical protein
VQHPQCGLIGRAVSTEDDIIVVDFFIPCSRGFKSPVKDVKARAFTRAKKVEILIICYQIGKGSILQSLMHNCIVIYYEIILIYITYS